MSEAGDQYFELEKKLLANEEAGDAIRDAMDGPWYEMTEEERDKANKLGPEYWNQYKKPLKVAEETVAEIDDALRAGADEELWPPGKTRGEAVAAIIERLYKTEDERNRLLIFATSVIAAHAVGHPSQLKKWLEELADYVQEITKDVSD